MTNVSNTGVDTIVCGQTVVMVAATAKNTDHRFRIYPDVYSDIKKALTFPEMGGILGMDQSGKIVKFHFDATGTTAKNLYTPDVKT